MRLSRHTFHQHARRYVMLAWIPEHRQSAPRGHPGNRIETEGPARRTIPGSFLEAQRPSRGITKGPREIPVPVPPTIALDPDVARGISDDPKVKGPIVTSNSEHPRGGVCCVRFLLVDPSAYQFRGSRTGVKPQAVGRASHQREREHDQDTADEYCFHGRSSGTRTL